MLCPVQGVRFYGQDSVHQVECAALPKRQSVTSHKAVSVLLDGLWGLHSIGWQCLFDKFSGTAGATISQMKPSEYYEELLVM